MTSRLYKITDKTLEGWKNQGITPNQIKFRGGGRFSTADADIAKALLNKWDNFSHSEQQALKGDYPDYINYLEQKRKEKEEKTSGKKENKSINEIITKIHKEIDPHIKKQEQEISEKMKKRYEFIHNEKDTLSNEEFTKKYGEEIRSSYGGRSYYSLDKFRRSLLGRLLIEKSPNDLIEKYQSAYREKEEGKVVSLFRKLQEKYPQIEKYKYVSSSTSIDGLEFALTGWDNEQNKYTINTNTITAGGYNIQILHLRWLMRVTDQNGKSVKIEQK